MAAGPSTGSQELAVIDRSKHPSGIVPQLQNIVATVNLDCKLDLKAIALQARNAEYNPKVLGGSQLHPHSSKTFVIPSASLTPALHS